MIDFVKFETKDFSRVKLLNHKNITWEKVINEDAVIKYEQGIFHGTKIILTKKKMTVHWKAHKMFNIIKGIGDLNYNRLTLESFTKVLEYLESQLSINTKKCRLINLEYGFNLENDDFDCIDCFLDQKFKYQSLHRTKWPSRDQKLRSGYIVRYKYSEKEIKVYNKGKKEKVDLSILRIEKKITRFRKIDKDLDLKKLSELKEENCFNVMFTDLMSEIEAILIVDKLLIDENYPASIKEVNLYNLFVNDARCKEFKDKKRRCSETFRKKKKQMTQLVKRLGLNKLHTLILNEMREEFQKTIQGKVANIPCNVNADNPNVLSITKNSPNHAA